jgi:hypothetical protein
MKGDLLIGVLLIRVLRSFASSLPNCGRHGEPPGRANARRHCERSEAIHAAAERKNGLLRRAAPRNDDVARLCAARPQCDCPTGKSLLAHKNLSSPCGKNISLFPKPKSVVVFAPSCSPQRGVSRTSRTWGGLRWTRWRRKTGGADADGKIVWSWRPDAGAKFSQGAIPAEVTGAKEPGPRGEHDISRKTIARGMPGVSGVTVVTNARAFYTTRAAAGASAPGIPCAL